MQKVNLLSKKKTMQFLAVIGTTFTLIVIVLGLVGFLNEPLFKTITDCIGLAVFIISIFYPKREILFVLNCFLFGTVNLLIGGHLLGFIYYITLTLISLKLGWFRTFPKIKITSISLFFIFITVTQLRFGINHFVISLVNISIGVVLFVALSLLFHDYLQMYYKQKPTLTLAQFNLDKRKLQCIKYIAQGFSINEIAKAVVISESVIKKELVDLYALFNVQNFFHFRFFLESQQIIFPEEEL